MSLNQQTLLQAAQNQRAIEAGCQQFISETAQKIYANRVAEWLCSRELGKDFSEREHNHLKKLAQECMSLAPYLAEAAGLPVKITYKDKT